MTDPWREDFAGTLAFTPPFAHLLPWCDALRGPVWPELATLNRLAAAQDLRNAAGLPIHFIAQRQRCGQRDYEAGILATGAVPSREHNWHDLLNALCWLAFPRSKAGLNRVQCATLGASEKPGDAPRGTRSDAATLFDESGLILAGTDDGMAELLATRQWRRAFVENRAAWGTLRVYAIGHAVLEKLLSPWPGITAKCLFLRLPEGASLPVLDEAVAHAWEAGRVSRPADLFPVPVLGIPGWSQANTDPAFYDDELVFRPPQV